MIKIIKQGVKPKKYKSIYFIKCAICECEFEFDLDDISLEKNTYVSYIIIPCPCCGDDKFIESDKLEKYKVREEEILEEIERVEKACKEQPTTPDPFVTFSPKNVMINSCPKCKSNRLLHTYKTDFLTSIESKCLDCGHTFQNCEIVLCGNNLTNQKL